VSKSVDQVRFITRVADARTTDRDDRMRRVAEPVATYASEMDAAALIEVLEKEMKAAAANLDFEAAARLRDQLFELRAKRETSDRVRTGALERIRARR
jgi:excinuclease ABC subunit B